MPIVSSVMTDLEKLKKKFPKLMIDISSVDAINKMETSSNEFVVAAKYFVDVFIKLGLTKDMVLQLEKNMPRIIKYANNNAIKNIIISRKSRKSRKSQKGGQLSPFVNGNYCCLILVGMILYLFTQMPITTTATMEQSLELAEGVDLPPLIIFIRSLIRLLFDYFFNNMYTQTTRPANRANQTTVYDILSLMTRMGNENTIMLISQIPPGLSIAIVTYLVMVYLFIVDISINSINGLISYLPETSRARDTIQRVISGRHPSRPIPSDPVLLDDFIKAHLVIRPPTPAQILPPTPAQLVPPPPTLAQIQDLDRQIAEARLHSRCAAGSVLDDAPEAFKDMAFSCEVMTDPVFAADGFTYERDNIQEWISRGNITSPITQVKLPAFTLTPNHSLRGMIIEWKKEHKAAAERNTAATRLQRWTRRKLTKQKSANPADSSGGSRRRRCKRKHRTQTKRRCIRVGGK